MRDRLNAVLGGLGLIALLAGLVVRSAEGQTNRAALFLWIAGALLVGLFFMMGREQIATFLLRRSTRYGGNALAAGLLLIALLAAGNYVSVRHHVRADLTHSKVYSPSDQTRKVAKALRRDVRVIGFFKKDDPTRAALDDLLRQYADLSPRFKIEYVDPDQKPQLAREYRVEELRTLVLASGEKVERLTSATEETITNALVRVTREGKKAICFLDGHGERSTANTEAQGLSALKEALVAENYDVRPLMLMTQEAVPADCALLVVASPEKPLLPNERAAIDAYLRRGGRALFLLDPGRDGGLGGFLAPWGLEVGNDIIYDVNPASRFLGAGEFFPLVLSYGDHPITRDFRVATLYREARTVRRGDPGGRGADVTELAKTDARSFALAGEIVSGRRIDPNVDRPGPHSIAVAAEAPAESDTAAVEGGRERKARLVVVGDADVATNQYIGVQGNRDFVMNSVNWLAGEEELIAIRAKSPEDRRVNLTRRQDRLVFYAVQFLMPALALVAGVAVWWRRR